MEPASRRLKVLWVDHVRRILGGAEFNLIELLAAPGTASTSRWDSSVACDSQGPLHRALGAREVPVHDYAFDPALGTLRVVGTKFSLVKAVRSLRALRQARRSVDTLLRHVRPDVVVSCTNKDHFAAWSACRRAGIPSVWWVNDIVSKEFFPTLACRAFLGQARRGATRIVVVSEFARRKLLTQGIPADRVVTIHNGVVPQHFQRGRTGALREQLGIDATRPVVGVVGRFTSWKGQEFFLQLAARFHDIAPNAAFVLVGHAFNEDQAYEAMLRERAAGPELRGRVFFVPFQKDVADVLGDLDVLVHTSLKPEPFGRVIIEAMAAGVPVLAARDGGVPEIVSHGENGFLAAPGDLEAYATSLQSLLEDPGLRARLAEAGRRTVDARFTLARVGDDFDGLFRSLPCAS